MAASEQPEEEHQHHITGHEVAKVLGSYEEHFTVKLVDYHQVEEEVAKNKGDGKLVEVIKGTPKEIQKITAKLEQTKMRVSPRRVPLPLFRSRSVADWRRQ